MLHPSWFRQSPNGLISEDLFFFLFFLLKNYGQVGPCGWRRFMSGLLVGWCNFFVGDLLMV